MNSVDKIRPLIKMSIISEKYNGLSIRVVGFVDKLL